MCLERRSMPRKAHIFLSIGNVCLSMGIALSLFNHNFSAHHPDWLDFTRGFLLGLAIVFLLFAARLSRRCSPADLLPR